MIKIKRSADNQYYFTVHGRNGEVIATSETYTKKDKARATAKLFLPVVKPWEGAIFEEMIIRKYKPRKKKEPQTSMNL